MQTTQTRKKGRPITNQGFPRINVRLPPDLFERLKDAAAKDYRPINSEIIRRLNHSFRLKGLDS